ncbi:thiaminase II [Streptacidiphilus sp. P02-A3a]|uniref:thiaminase II n=1 Tax=Streptacidiphilus sp. P02-A3a TaxID=2704468 RepID=UPI0015FCCCC4|nr:thiaminase II [Streptacidiphilus sp. P02-A3a]QMU66889.1 thiaminase II [Streptacidiphilus sp. P02-A3a]
MTTSFSDQLWAAGDAVHREILVHPFLRGLTDGSLPRAAFRHFVVQDSHYLRDYARALAVCAAKAPTEEDVRAFANDAVGALAAEQEMHADFMAELGPAPAAPGGASKDADGVLPTTRAYTSYLLATVYSGSFAEGLAAVLPCYWIYARVGAELLAKSSPDPLYARWIASYADEEFQSVVRRVLRLADRLGEELSEAERRRAAEHFAVTARYEWMFWDAAWRGETWPVPAS